MFEWLSIIYEPRIPANSKNGELRIKRIESRSDLFKKSEVCQLFASFDVILNEQALTSFPTPNEKAISNMLNEVVPHYKDVKQIFIDGKLKEINVRGLKEELKNILENLLGKGIYPVIPDLYRSKSLKLRAYPRTLKYYKNKKRTY